MLVSYKCSSFNSLFSETWLLISICNTSVTRRLFQFAVQRDMALDCSSNSKIWRANSGFNSLFSETWLLIT